MGSGCEWIDVDLLSGEIGEQISVGDAQRDPFNPDVIDQYGCSIYAGEDYVGMITAADYGSAPSARTDYESFTAGVAEKTCWDGSTGPVAELEVTGADMAMLYACGEQAFALTGRSTVFVGLIPGEIELPTETGMAEILTRAVELNPYSG